MNTDIARQLNLPPVNQVGFVVRDLKQAIRQYEPLFGEFVEMDAPDMEWDYRGEPAVSSLKLAMAQSGDVEIELIEWVAGKTPHKEFLDAGREGLHHLRFIVDNVDDKMKEAEGLGYKAIWYKRFAEGLAAVYLEREGDPLVIEFFENHHG
jgi:hypothetical protein